MNLLIALNALLLLVAQPSIEEVEIQPTDFRIQAYPYGAYYSYPPYCPPGYSYGPGVGLGNRGFSFYVGPGYPGYYGYPGCYWGRNYYGPRYYHGHRYYHRGHGGRYHGGHGGHRH